MREEGARRGGGRGRGRGERPIKTGCTSDLPCNLRLSLPNGTMSAWYERGRGGGREGEREGEGEEGEEGEEGCRDKSIQK